MKTYSLASLVGLAAALLSAGLAAPRARANPQAPNASTTSAPSTGTPSAAAGTMSHAQDAQSVPELPPEFSGTFREGLERVRQHAEKHELEPALGIAAGMLAPNAYARWRLAAGDSGGVRAFSARALDRLAESQGWLGYPAAARAEVHYALGVALRENERPDEAAKALESARADAGAGALRLEAIAALGGLRLAAAEAQRALIPEISGQPASGAPGIPTGPGAAPGTSSSPGQVPAPGTALPAGPGGAPEPPDPLQLARVAYLAAREHFIERLRADWRDPDTQANTELIQKRLRELDEIEKKREEEKQEQEKQDEQQKEDQKDQKQDDKQKQDQKDEKSDENKDPKEPPPDPKDQEKKEEPKEEKQDEKPKPEDAEKDETRPEPKAADSKEQAMSKEEMTQLLDRLQQIEEQWKKLQEQLKSARRVRVPKDW